MNPDIVAIVATYNRKDLLRECLDALLRQTRAPQRIIVVDNACTDDTPGMLDRDYPSVEVIHLSVNAGSSGGVHAGMKRALQLNCDWAWIMDDDAEPADDALEQLCHHVNHTNLAALACLKTDSLGRPLHHHRGYFTFDQLPRRILCPITREQLAPGRPLDIDHASFVGLMVNAKAARAVGLPDQRLFLQFDDVEYCIRLRTFGNVRLIPDSRIIHKEQTPKGIQHHRLLGQPYDSVPYADVWKRYFVYRNFVWLTRNHGTRRLKIIFGLPALYLFLFIATLRYETKRPRRILTLTAAFLDGIHGDFDNSRPWRLLYHTHRNTHPGHSSGGDAS